MSKETLEWLNSQCLIGYTDKRGNAWHYKASAQGVEPNHYPGAIPVEDIVRRLFNFQAIKSPVFTQFNGELIEVPNRKAISASDDGHVFNIFTDGYEPHQYEEWLIDNVASLISQSHGELGIGSAILLQERGQACVQIEVPDTITTRDGVQFRPWIAAATSLNGSLATIYKRCFTDIVCDNTRERGFAEEGQEFRLKHTRYSHLRLGDARSALEIIFAAGEAFQASVDALCATQVSEREWSKVLAALVPEASEGSSVRTSNSVDRKRSQLHTLWCSDERVTPWRNTAWGVSQAFNTYDQHLATVKSVHRVERNLGNALSGKTGTADLKVLDVLGAILDKELVRI